MSFSPMPGTGFDSATSAILLGQAMSASGAVIRLEPNMFQSILDRAEAPLLVHSSAGFFGTYHQYLTSYKGLLFCTKSKEPLALPDTAEIIEAKQLVLPV